MIAKLQSGPHLRLLVLPSLGELNRFSIFHIKLKSIFICPFSCFFGASLQSLYGFPRILTLYHPYHIINKRYNVTSRLILSFFNIAEQPRKVQYKKYQWHFRPLWNSCFHLLTVSFFPVHRHDHFSFFHEAYRWSHQIGFNPHSFHSVYQVSLRHMYIAPYTAINSTAAVFPFPNASWTLFINRPTASIPDLLSMHLNCPSCSSLLCWHWSAIALAVTFSTTFPGQFDKDITLYALATL